MEHAEENDYLAETVALTKAVLEERSKNLKFFSKV